MKTRTTLSVAVTAFALTSAAASAAIEFGAAPDGFGVVATVTGTQATPRNASRWFDVADAEAVRTNWANEAITFSTSGLLADSYMLGITAKNDGGPGLPSNYSNFQVDVRVNGKRQVYIPIYRQTHPMARFTNSSLASCEPPGYSARWRGTATAPLPWCLGPKGRGCGRKPAKPWIVWSGSTPGAGSGRSMYRMRRLSHFMRRARDCVRARDYD